DAPSRRLALEELSLELGDTRLALSGLVDDVGPRPRVDLKAHGENVDLAEVLSWISVADAQAVKGITGSGRLTFALAARGSAAPGSLPALIGAAAIKDAAFRYAGASAGVDGLSLTAKLGPDTLLVPDLRATVSGQPVTARLLVSRFADPLVEFIVHGNVDLAAVAPILAPAGTQLAGRAAVNLSGRGRARDAGAPTPSGTPGLTRRGVPGAAPPQD